MDFFHNLPERKKILAPMVDNSDQAYRKLARSYGADICYTEMVHAKQFLMSKSKGDSNRWYTTDASDTPLVIQLCGNNPDLLLQTGKIVQVYCNAIDINFGCPQNIARKGQYGAYLQDDWKLTSDLIRTLNAGLDKPIFCKIRIFDDLQKTLDYANMIQQSGCQLLTVHGRTREQKGIHTGLANWNTIKAVKASLSIPVVSNGNILYKEDVKRAFEFTKCDGVMVAETHLYNPMIFSDDDKTCFEVVREYLELCIKIKTRFTEVKSHVFKILHRVLDNKDGSRDAITNCRNVHDLITMLDSLELQPLNCIDLSPRIRNQILQ